MSDGSEGSADESSVEPVDLDELLGSARAARQQVFVDAVRSISPAAEDGWTELLRAVTPERQNPGGGLHGKASRERRRKQSARAATSPPRSSTRSRGHRKSRGATNEVGTWKG